MSVEMVNEPGETVNEPAGGGERSTCTPCRGSGQVVSTLGGDPHEVTCPWCGGSGRFTPGRDAQAAGPVDPQGGAHPQRP